jgi:uncharacterized protein (DUF1015 family)
MAKTYGAWRKLHRPARWPVERADRLLPLTLRSVPDLRPFRALRYDPRAVADPSAVICPPYDVISPERQRVLAARHPRNAVHLELPLAIDGDDPYERAARHFSEWQADGTLRRDDEPRIYVYEQDYMLNGRSARSRGFFCLLRLEPWGAGVRRHELTLSGPKEDRYQLLRAVEANLSPVLMLYSSRNAGAASGPLLDRLTDASPAVEATDDEGVGHRLWPAAATSADASELLRLVAAAPLTVADGHHRYETALRYQVERAGAVEGSEQPSDFVLVLLYEAQTGGLAVLPTHRVLRGLPPADDFNERVAELFAVEHVGSLREARRRITAGGRLILCTKGGISVLTPRPVLLDKVGGTGSPVLREMEVSVLNAALPSLVGLSAGDLVESGQLSYTKDADEAFGLVAAGDADACVLLPPAPVESVLAVAANGEHMPEKSTYFYPKAATGLVFNTLRS